MFSWRPTCHARAPRSTTSRRRAWFFLLLGGIYTTQEPASIAQAFLPPRDPEAMPPHGPSRSCINTSSLGAKFVKCLSCRLPHLPPTFWLRVTVACPMAHTTPRVSPPSRHSETDFTGTPSETGDLTWVVPGVIGAERSRIVGVFVRAHEPYTHFWHPLSWHESIGQSGKCFTSNTRNPGCRGPGSRISKRREQMWK